MRAPEPTQAPVARFPLSATQERCWFLDRLMPGNPALNVPFRWELRGAVGPEAIEAAIRLVIERHEILRTRFVEGDGGPVQEVVETVPFRLGQVDIRAVAEAERAARVDEIAAAETLRPFDLAQAGLIRATHVRVAPDRAFLLVTIHQTCFDGYSIGVMGREIAQALRAAEGSAALDLPELDLQYGDFCLWQQELFASGVLDEDRAWWIDRLRDAPYTELPPDKPRPAQRDNQAVQHHLMMPEVFGDRLAQAARAHEVSTFTLGAAVVSACLGRILAEREVVFGTQVAGRADSMLEDLIGVFINNVLLRIDTDPSRPLAGQVAVAREAVEGALAHQAFPFNRLVEALNPQRDPSRTPLISVNYGLQTVFMTGHSGETFELVSAPAQAPGAVYDLSIVLIGRETGWRLNVEYATALFDPETAEALADMVRDTFETLFEGGAATIGALPTPTSLQRSGGASDPVLEALLAHPDVAEAALVPDGAAPFAFVVPAADSAAPLETLPRSIAADLAAEDAPRPSGISLRSALPRRADGGVDVTRLKVPRRVEAQDGGRGDPGVLNTVRSIWAEVLGVERVPSGASFFDLGGHSLMAVRMLTRLNERLGSDLDVATLYENPTPIGLAAAVPARGQAPAKDWRILTLRDGGAGIPLIGINNASTVLAVAATPGFERPAFCLRLMDAEGGGIMEEDATWTEIASRYADLAERARPEGPVALFGNCVHGNLAAEVAQQLTERGREVAGLMLKDVWEPGYSAGIRSNRTMRRRERMAALRNRIRLWREGKISWDAVLGSYRLVRATGMLQLAARLGVIERMRSSDLEAEQEAFNIWLAERRDAHGSTPVTVPVLHLVTRITPQGPGFAESIGWEDAAGGRLVTRHLDDLGVWRGREVGAADTARALSEFLGDQSA